MTNANAIRRPVIFFHTRCVYYCVLHKWNISFILNMAFAMSRRVWDILGNHKTPHVCIWHGVLRFPRKSQVRLCYLQGLRFPSTPVLQLLETADDRAHFGGFGMISGFIDLSNSSVYELVKFNLSVHNRKLDLFL